MLCLMMTFGNRWFSNFVGQVFINNVIKNKMYYYSNQCINYNLSKRQLQEKIKSKEYERLDDETKNKLINQGQTTVSDFIM